MEEILINSDVVLDVPEGSMGLTIVHEWGDTVLLNEQVLDDTHVINLDSIGVHKFIWLDENGENVSTEFLSSVLPLAPNEDPEYSLFERHARMIIQNYTGQKFGPYVDKTLEIQGDGGDSLALPLRMTVLKSINSNFGRDITDLVELYPGEPSIIKRAYRFRGSVYHDVKRDLSFDNVGMFDSRYKFEVNGDWGWEYVPPEVSEGAKILIDDWYGNDDISDMRRRGVVQSQLGDFMIKLNADQWGSTGNNMVDNMLAGYVNMGIGLI